jgi:hypothetical protein
MNLDAEQATHVRTKLDEYGRGADPDCARAMAEAENVLRELSLDALFRRQSSPGGSTSDETPKAPPLHSRTSSVPALASFSIDRLHLDPDLDFVVHADGTIELTAAGFRRMVQAHSAGLDTVIEVDGRNRLYFPAPSLACPPSVPTR